MFVNAIHKPIVPIPLPSDQEASGRTLGEAEIAFITEAIRTGTLTSTKGRFTKDLELCFAKLLGLKHAHACASGSGAIHCAVAAINPEPGDEIITSGITDMGAIAPIVYQGAIPVFADVDPRTGNLTAESIESRISTRTKAIIVTHLFGNPCDMTSIMAVAEKNNLPVIEDCAQAFLAHHHGRTVGTIGSIGCFSLQQGKHITTGEGGLVTTSDPTLSRRMYLFINKAWGYGDAQPDHYFLALNNRMSELQGACALAQLSKLGSVVESRIATAHKMNEMLQDLPGVQTPWKATTDSHVYWKYCLQVNPRVIRGGAVGMAKVLKEVNIASAPRYIQKPAFRCQVIAQQRTFGNSRWPFTLARDEAVDYRSELFPGTFEYLDQVLVLPWNERYTDEHLNFIATSVRGAAQRLAGEEK